MRPKDIVSTLIEKLNIRLSVPVHTTGIEETRPIPAVLVSGVSIEPENFHNSNFAGNEWQDGSVVSQVHRQYYSARVDLVVRANEETNAYQTLGNLQNELSLIEIDPREYLHDDVRTVTVGSSGEVRYQFNEPMETELNQSLTIESFYDTAHEDFDTIESVSKTYDFN